MKQPQTLGEFAPGRQFRDTRDNFLYEIVACDSKEVVAVNVNGFKYVTNFETIEIAPRSYRRPWTPRTLATAFRKGKYEWVEHPT